MRYLRGRISSSLHHTSAVNASSPSVGIASDSYLRIKKKGALTSWSTRYLVLRGAQLVWFANKQDAQWRRGVQEMLYVDDGKLTTLRSGELGFEIKTTDGREWVARTFDRGDLARWITAFYRLALKRETKRMSEVRLSETLTADSTATGASESDQQETRQTSLVAASTMASTATATVDGKPLPQAEGRHVSFHSSVLVRMIPTVSDDQIPELFYSREDMERFSARASSILCRTEEAVSCAYLAIRRPYSISCKTPPSTVSE